MVLDGQHTHAHMVTNSKRCRQRWDLGEFTRHCDVTEVIETALTVHRVWSLRSRGIPAIVIQSDLCTTECGNATLPAFRAGSVPHFAQQAPFLPQA